MAVAWVGTIIAAIFAISAATSGEAVAKFEAAIEMASPP
jgi:hypothetical protein